MAEVETKLSTTAHHIYTTDTHQESGKDDVEYTPNFSNDLKSTILCLASSAGILAFVRNELAHRALASLDTVENDKIPAEILTTQLNPMHDLILSLVEALHVRSVQISDMSLRNNIKFAFAAKALCSNAIQIGLQSAFVNVAKQLLFIDRSMNL